MKQYPFVTIIIPARNEANNIVNSINSLFRQDYPQQLTEIIVVDNGSTDDTATLATKIGVKVVHCPTGNIGYIRNYGAAAGKGQILAYLDADCVVPVTWLRSMVRLLDDPKVGAVGGYFRAPVDANWIERCWALKKKEVQCNVKILATGSFGLSRKVFDFVGGFDETLTAGEDTNISRKIIGAGLLLILTPSVSAIHYGYPNTILNFIKRQRWQTTNYLQTRKYGFDAIFFVSNIFLACLLFMLIGVLINSQVVIIFSFFCCLVLSCILGVFRFSTSVESFSTLKLFQIILINFLYLFGRSLGLLSCYYSFLFQFAWRK